MKKNNIAIIIIFFCAALILQSCGQSEKEIIAQNYPKIDGSTSSLPIVQAIYKIFHKPEIVDGEQLWSGLPQSASQTIESYKMLIEGETDLIIVPDPSEEVQKLAEEKGAELEYVPICLEALVFIVNKTTQINNITTEELKSIYTDMQINKWSQLGESDKYIFALVRNEDSGSHALMEKFVLKGAKVHEDIEMNNMALSMVAMVDEVENYVNYNGGAGNSAPLGYTIYYYFQNNKESQKWNSVKLLGIDGAEPNDATIASGEYPYSTYYYAVIKSDTPKDSPERKLISWLLSNEGQRIFAESGFGGIFPVE